MFDLLNALKVFPRRSTESRHNRMDPLTNSIRLSNPKAVRRTLRAAIPAPIETPISMTIQIMVKTSICTPILMIEARVVVFINKILHSLKIRKRRISKSSKVFIQTAAFAAVPSGRDAA